MFCWVSHNESGLYRHRQRALNVNYCEMQSEKIMWEVTVRGQQRSSAPPLSSRGRMEWITWLPAPPWPTFSSSLSSEGLFFICVSVPPFVLLPSPNFLASRRPSRPPQPLLSCLPLPPWAPRLPPALSSAPFVFDLIYVASCFLAVRNYKSHSPQRLPRDLKGGCWSKW